MLDCLKTAIWALLSELPCIQTGLVFLLCHSNPTALRKAKIAYSFGLSECIRVKGLICFPEISYLRGFSIEKAPGRQVKCVEDLTRKSEVLGSIPSLATYFRFSFR